MPTAGKGVAHGGRWLRRWARWHTLAAIVTVGSAAPVRPADMATLDPTRGAVVARPEGGHVQLVIQEAHLELWFFDAAGRRIPASWERGVVIYRSPAHLRETALLRPSADRLALRSIAAIDEPFAFHAHVALFPRGASAVARRYEFAFDRGTGRS